jgi:hypothetical protein
VPVGVAGTAEAVCGVVAVCEGAGLSAIAGVVVLGGADGALTLDNDPALVNDPVLVATAAELVLAIVVDCWPSLGARCVSVRVIEGPAMVRVTGADLPERTPVAASAPTAIPATATSVSRISASGLPELAFCGGGGVV